MVLSSINHAYAFGTPHRLTTALPDSADITLLDVDATGVDLKWTYERLTDYPTGAFAAPSVPWSVRLEPSLEGREFTSSAWTRLEGWLPILQQVFSDEKGTMTLTASGVESATIVKVRIENLADKEQTYKLTYRQNGWGGFNLA